MEGAGHSQDCEGQAINTAVLTTLLTPALTLFEETLDSLPAELSIFLAVFAYAWRRHSGRNVSFGTC